MRVVNTNSKAIKNVDVFSIAIVSKTFDPEKHSALARLMAHAYGSSGDPLRVLEG